MWGRMEEIYCCGNGLERPVISDVEKKNYY